MGVLASDNFNRTSAADLGAAWDPLWGDAGSESGGFDIVSNTVAQPPNFGQDRGESNNTVSWPNDQYAQAKVTVAGTNDQSGLGVLVRQSTTASTKTTYWAIVNKAASNNVSVHRLQAGASLLGQRTTTWVDGDVLKLVIQGTTLQVYKNDVQLGANFTNGDIASGKAGIAYSSTTTSGTLDDWEGGDMGPAPGHQLDWPNPKGYVPGIELKTGINVFEATFLALPKDTLMGQILM